MTCPEEAGFSLPGRNASALGRLKLIPVNLMSVVSEGRECEGEMEADTCLPALALPPITSVTLGKLLGSLAL